MLSAILNKFTAVIFGISIFFIADFTGNEPKITNLGYDLVDNGIELKGELSNAFEYDFDEILSSGLKILILYETEVRARNRRVLSKQTVNSVVHDHVLQQWIIDYGDEEVYFFDQLEDAKQALEKILITLHGELSQFEVMQITVRASLPNVQVPASNNSYEMMLLWKKIVPQAKLVINL